MRAFGCSFVVLSVLLLSSLMMVRDCRAEDEEEKEAEVGFISCVIFFVKNRVVSPLYTTVVFLYFIGY